MGHITNDEQGIPDKKLYNAIARHFKKGLFTPRQINEDMARSCTDLELKVEVTDLNFLRFFPNVDTLSVDSANLADIQGLHFVPNLDWLAIPNHRISDISPISNCPKLAFLQLQVMEGNGTGWTSTSGIADFRVIGRLSELSTLVLDNVGVNDISWITSLTKLVHVVLSRNPISDFSPLLELPAEGIVVEIDSSQKEYIDGRFSRMTIDIDI